MQTQRKRWLAIVVGAFAAIGIAYGAYWAIALRYVQTTDDAYVNGNVVQITPQLSANDIFYASSSLPSQRILARLFRRHGATGRNAFRIGRYVGHQSALHRPACGKSRCNELRAAPSRRR